MNRNINMFGKTIPVWFLTIAIVGAGSMAIAVQGGAVHQEDAPDIQAASDVKIHLQDVDGKIITNVPIAASRAFSPLPVEFTDDADPPAVDANGDGIFNAAADVLQRGSTIVTKQKVVLNMVLDTSEDYTVRFGLDNNSEDAQIFLIKANAPSNVMLDFETDGPGADVTVHGLTGHNEWLASIPLAASNAKLLMEVSVTDAGFYPIVVELLRIG